jgi:hypothetical protein
MMGGVSLPEALTAEMDDEQPRNLGVLLLDERGSGTGADRPPADSSVSSTAVV